ncbi:hypothetical protein LEP1GSC050_0498 [Leptospira broomii serovar Hurstbridge str. 5399]|uniref:Uncharacterized protein n=1 Tax=Leptospira broomii serovar Hurstbridge str. 5399 TaxID=1049789 RepID=T0F5Q5_9LEPT|nr:hypothetical protein LEP1GSC050_0498 [Leptospira broomii serovar Hurstbridge str. 5399]
MLQVILRKIFPYRRIEMASLSEKKITSMPERKKLEATKASQTE